MDPETNTQIPTPLPADPTKPILQTIVGYKNGLTTVVGLKLGLLTLGPDLVLTLYEQEPNTGRVLGGPIFQVPIASVLHFSDYYNGLTFQPGPSAPQMYFEIKQPTASSRYDIMSGTGKQLWYAAVSDLEVKPDMSPPIRDKKSVLVKWAIVIFFVLLSSIVFYLSMKNQ